MLLKYNLLGKESPEIIFQREEIPYISVPYASEI